MKTLTLRLTENEAEALNRMSACYGMSKNRLLTALIAEQYENFSLMGEAPDPADYTGIAYDFPALVSFPDRLEECFFDHKYAIPEKQCINRILAAYDYALENETDPHFIKMLKNGRESFPDRVKEMVDEVRTAYDQALKGEADPDFTEMLEAGRKNFIENTKDIFPDNE